MKKLILGIAAVATFTSASAQKNRQVYPETAQMNSNTGFYVNVNGGYNFPIAGETLMVNEDYTGTADSYDDVVGSFGKGANAGVAVGYMLTPNMGAELGFNYLFGSEYSATIRDNAYLATTTMKGNMFQLSPSVVMRTNSSSALNHYVKAGLLIGLGTKVTEDFVTNAGISSLSYQREYTGNPSLGFTGAVGMDYAINSKISLFGEVKGNALTYKPKESEIVEAKVNGQDVLPTLSVRDRYTTYHDTYTDNGTINEADRQSRISLPFSSIGLNVGVRFKF